MWAYASTLSHTANILSTNNLDNMTVVLVFIVGSVNLKCATNVGHMQQVHTARDFLACFSATHVSNRILLLCLC